MLLITLAILFVLKAAATDIYRRLMDAVDPELLDAAERALRTVPGVLDIEALRLRWVGHRIRAETALVVDAGLSLVEALSYDQQVGGEDAAKTTPELIKLRKAAFEKDLNKAAVIDGIYLSVDLQHIANPAYDAARGPVVGTSRPACCPRARLPVPPHEAGVTGVVPTRTKT